jgi:hypothetical protein
LGLFPNHENELSNNLAKNPPRFVRPFAFAFALTCCHCKLYTLHNIYNFHNSLIIQIHNLTRLNSSSATKPPATWARM